MVPTGRCGHPPGMPFTLLVVDDSNLICTSLQALLAQMTGIEAMHTAHTLAQALEKVRQLLPSLLILDIHLPDGNAIQSLSTLKRLAPGMRIAMLTNDVNDFNRRKCLEAGADWFFDKSIEFDDLLDVVQQQAALASTPPSLPHEHPNSSPSALSRPTKEPSHE